MTSDASPIDVKAFWQAVGGRAVGTAVVTSSGALGRAGFLALSATHLSASPPAMMVAIDAKTSALGTIRDSGHFAINYLPYAARALVAHFAGRTELSGEARFSDPDWTVLKTGAPVLQSAVVAFDCQLDSLIERRGTFIAIGSLVAILSNAEAVPLISFKGGFIEH